MKSLLVATILLLLILGSGAALAVFAKPSVQQTLPPCPTYQTNLEVIFVDAKPNNDVQAGTNVVVTVEVVYANGDPATLAPETISLLLTGTNGQKELDNLAVLSAAKPGFYILSLMMTADLIQTIGQGKVTIWVVSCSCSDGLGNRGPTSNVNSDLTITPDDNSILNIPVPPPPPGINPIVPLLIILALLIAAIILVLRRRKQGKKT